MKKTLFNQSSSLFKLLAAILLLSGYSFTANGQFTNTPEGRLALLCKTWGMVKYHHTQVKIGNVNWDSVLVAHVLNVRNAATLNDFNIEMNSLVDAAGTMQLTLSPSVPNMPINVDFSWIPDPMLDSTLQWKLNFIKNNFVADSNYYVSFNPWIISFPHDDSATPNDTFPVLENRFLYMFRFWNIINYYFPYRHDMDILWDQSLVDLIPAFDTASSALSYHLAFALLNARLNDTHAVFPICDILKNYFDVSKPYVPVYLRQLNNQAVIFRMFDTIPGLHEGDIIHKINGMDIDSLRMERRKYYSQSTDGVADFYALSGLLQQYSTPSVQFEVEDSTGTINNVTVTTTWAGPAMVDSIFTCSWCGPAYQLTTCGYGYVNMGKLQPTQVNAMYNMLHNAPAIIFDLRSYPHLTVWDIADKMFNVNTAIARAHLPIAEFPGDYSLYVSYIGINGNPTPYLGKIYILVNEITHSQGESSARILSLSPCASAIKTIGSTTAGSDGDVSSFKFPGDIEFTITGLGIYYPDSTVTQRVGVAIDSVVIPTPAGIRHGIDEVLMAAFDCLTGMNENRQDELSFNVYPNPGNGIFNLQLNNKNNEQVSITVFDVIGRIIFEKDFGKHGEQFNESIDLSNFFDGIYLIQVARGEHTFSQKVIVQHN